MLEALDTLGVANKMEAFWDLLKCVVVNIRLKVTPMHSSCSSKLRVAVVYHGL